MDGVTLGVAIVAGLLIFALKPRHGLGVYIALLMTYPQYLAVSIGTIDLTSSRIVICILLLRVLADRDTITGFRWVLMDALVVGLFAWGTLALTMTEGTKYFETRGGTMMDTVFVYFAARLTLRNWADFLTVAKWAAAIVIPMALIGITESVTGWTPYSGLMQYSFQGIVKTSDQRLGLNRASGAVGLHIVFGMCFVALAPLALALVKEHKPWSYLGWAGFAAALLGTFSSVSSGPFLCCIIFLFCLVLIFRPSLVKPVLAFVILTGVAAEIGSNRHFYYLLDYISFSKTSWYRARLLEVAVQKLPQYWLFGYGMGDPGWGELLDQRSYTDVCDEYILQAVRYGVLGTILFMAILCVAIVRMKRAYRGGGVPGLRSTAWYMGSMVIGVACALYSVGLLAVMVMLFYAMLGAIASRVFDVPAGRRGAFGPGVARIEQGGLRA